MVWKYVTVPPVLGFSPDAAADVVAPAADVVAFPTDVVAPLGGDVVAPPAEVVAPLWAAVVAAAGVVAVDFLSLLQDAAAVSIRTPATAVAKRERPTRLPMVPPS